MRIPVRILPLTLLAVLHLACDGDPVTLTEQARFALDAERAADFRVAIEDLRERVLPHLEQSSQAGLPDALEGVARALETRLVVDLDRALGDSDASLAELAAGPDARGIAPDLEAVRLVLLQARYHLLELPPVAP